MGPWLTLWQPAQGGHVGFPRGPLPGHIRAMPKAVGGWLASHLNRPRTQDDPHG